MWQRDDPWHCDWDAYVDRETGEVVWVSREEGGPMSEEEIADALSRVLSDPQRYEFIPPLVHGEHHAVFADWLKTIPRNIRDVCNTVSIGGFHETLEEHFPEEAPVLWGDWQGFHEQALQHRAEAWLRERGIELVWR